MVGDSSTGELYTGLGPLLLALGWPTFAYSMFADSPATDAGNPGGCINWNGTLLDTDQVGYLRPSGGQCDIGSREISVTGEIFADGSIRACPPVTPAGAGGIDADWLGTSRDGARIFASLTWASTASGASARIGPDNSR